MRQPLLAVYEDLHWADPSTLELLGVLLEQTPTVPILTVLTFRPVFVPPWPNRSHLTPMSLNRLERPHVEALMTHLAGGKALPAEVIAHIVAKTDGVPLFVEELTKMLLESDLLQEDTQHYVLTGPLSAVTIPATLQDSLMARLDRLGAARDVAQLGAVVGREFAYDMLQALAPLDEATLQARLVQLVEAELLYQRGRPPQARYVFKHALIQDAAYASLLKSTRQQVHQQVVQVLETQFPARVETQQVFRIGQDLGAGCRLYAAMTLWCLGYPAQSLAQLHDVLALAHTLVHPLTLAWAQAMGSMLYHLRRDVSAVYEHAEAAVVLSTEQGIPLRGAMGTSTQGWALAMQGRGEEGIALIRKGVAAWRATGAGLTISWFCILLTEGFDTADLQEAKALLNELT